MKTRVIFSFESTMAGLSITGQMKVSTLKEGFLKKFGLTRQVMSREVS